MTTSTGQRAVAAADIGPLESVESFRLRAKSWLAANLRPLADAGTPANGVDDAVWRRSRELQKTIHQGGFAGICYPREYGGLGLTPAHQAAFNDEATKYEMPALATQMSTLAICGPTILETASEDLKREHLAAAIRGEEVIVQFISEPASGSDMAGATTRATRAGDEYILNGAKIWSSGAYAADYALCLARTNWDVPKHQGLSMFLVKLNQPGIVIQTIKQLNGNTEFCQEFLDDVRVPAQNLIGVEDGGWAVATRMLVHERNAVGGGSPYLSGASKSMAAGSVRAAQLARLVRATGQADDPRARELVAEAHALSVIQEQLIARVGRAIGIGELAETATSVIRLFSGESASRRAEIALELAGSHGVFSGQDGSAGDLSHGAAFVFRQAWSIGGGTTEMARNIISERVLGMPREPAADRDVPFNQVHRGRS